MQRILTRKSMYYHVWRAGHRQDATKTQRFSATSEVNQVAITVRTVACCKFVQAAVINVST